MKKHTIIAFFTFALLSHFANLKATENDRFESIMTAHWLEQLKQNPIFATSLGVRDFDAQLQDPSLLAYAESVTQSRDFLSQLKQLNVDDLSVENRLNLSLLSLDLENDIKADAYGGKFLIMNNRSGPHLTLTNMVSRLPFFKLEDYLSYIARLDLMPEYLGKATARIKAGLDEGWVQACEPMQGFEQSIETHLVDDINDSVFMAPFVKKPSIIKDSDFAKNKKVAEKIIVNKIIPALSKFKDFYVNQYSPKCRAKVGIDQLPGGEGYYDYLVSYYTTTNVTANQVHQTGLAEVARIKTEMMQVIKEANFKGSFEEWLVYLRDTPEFYPKTAEERMQVASTISKKMDGELPKLFGKLPRMPYGLKEIPLDIAKKTTTAYYQRPAGDGSRAGMYFVNTTLLGTRPLYQLEALSLHEAVPGHHLQIALAQELDLPNFRKYGGQTVFVEGWGLYAERLGLEVGFYQTPYTNFGRLSYEMWRACRLVVDTGLHSKDWTRQQAIDYMAANSGLSMNNIVSEVDRYISWPGQALAYKTGELKIRELRTKAETELGDKFDIRAFHDTVLKNGALPLSVLEAVVVAWIKEQ